jgi:hypothetical protein
MGVVVSQATVIMISSLLEDSSDGFIAVLIQMIITITNKAHNLLRYEEFSRETPLVVDILDTTKNDYIIVDIQ